MNIPHELAASGPLEVNGELVNSIDVRKPCVFDLHDLKLTDVLQMDTQAMVKLLPRITEPSLTTAQVAALDPADFVALCGKAILFFSTDKKGVCNGAE